MNMSKILAGACAISVLSAGSAFATVVGGAVTAYPDGDINDSNFVLLSVPFSESNPENTVGNNNFDTPNLYAFDEDQNIVLTEDLNISGGATLTAGTTVASHYVFFDPKGSRRQSGYVDFDSDIIGLASSTQTMNASDFLANNNVNYLNPGARGLERNDIVTFEGSRLFVDWKASSPGDYVRVFTERSPGAAVVPLPAALPLFATALAGLGFLSRRRRAA